MSAAGTQRRKRKQARRGSTIVEGAVVLSLLAALTLVILNLGLATFRYNVLRSTAELLAREAIVRGKDASPEKVVWGPARHTGSAADGSEFASQIVTRLPTMDPGDVRIEVSWLDGDNDLADRVQVQLQYTHVTFVPFVELANSYDLKATATMRIMH